MGHRKGNEGELEVVKLLEPWWRKLEPEALFVRTPRSGGWLAGRDHFDARGDLMVQHAPRFPWLVEVKRREAWALENFEQGKPTAVWAWWNHACEDARHAGRKPMLWFRRNKLPWIVLVPACQMNPSCKLPDFEWPGDLPGPRGSSWILPKGYWEDRFLDSAPFGWV